jgi:hypothetical protein
MSDEHEDPLLEPRSYQSTVIPALFARLIYDMTLFWNPAEGRLRAGWRLILQALLMAALALIPIFGIAEPLTALHRRGLFLPGYGHEAYDRVINMIVGPFLAAAVIGSIAIAAR